jgi:hypothetical protein
MKNKLLLISLLLQFGFGLTELNAQTKLYINKKAGTQTSFTTSSIRTLTFATGRMAINKTDKSANSCTLSGIRYLSFNDYTTGVTQIVSSQNSSMAIYPNPVADQLQISYETVKAGIAKVEIIDLQGKILLQVALNSNAGVNHAQIMVTKLPKSIYLCRVINGSSIETSKFLKQ